MFAKINILHLQRCVARHLTYEVGVLVQVGRGGGG